MGWLRLTRKDISPVEWWVKDGVIFQMTALPDPQSDAMGLLRFYLHNASLTQGVAGSATSDEQQQIWSKVYEILAGGEK